MKIIHVLLVILVVFVWGFNFVVLTIGLEEMPPLLLAFARFFLTSIPAIFFIEKPKSHLKMIIGYGLISFSIHFSLLFFGMVLGMTPSLAAIILQVRVFISILLAAIVFHEELNQWQILGALISFSGIAYIAINLGGSMNLTGFLCILAAAASWATGNIISKKMEHINALSLVIWGSLFAWPPLLAVSLILDGPDQFLYTLQHLSWSAIGSVLFITLFATLFCFGVWGWLLRQYPLNAIAPFSLLIPIFGTFSSVLFLDEPLQNWKIIAAVLVLSGLCINLWGSKLQFVFSKSLQAKEPKTELL